MSENDTVERHGMKIDWDVGIEMSDNVVLRADVYRPVSDGEYPVIMTYGPYGKWLHFEDGYEKPWNSMVEKHPETIADSSNTYQNWETVDPEKWVPDGYVVIRVDSRGAGRSEGHMNIWSEQEADDFAECIEWAGEQPWSNGKVGLNGISYYAMNQWQVASRQPDHLAAICAWEGAADWYRDFAYHGGIYNTFAQYWYPKRVVPIQHGVGDNGFRSRMTGKWVSGPETLSKEERGANRNDLEEDILANPLADEEYWKSRKPDWDQINVPLLSAANWGGHGLHPRGNFEGFREATTDEKWLEVHGKGHWTHFYTDYGQSLQKQFFGHFLKDEDTGWDDQPPVQLQVRHPDETFEERHEEDWPLPRTEWTPYYLDTTTKELAPEEPAASSSTTYDALGDGVTFLSDPLDEETEITGPISSKLFISSDTEDADLFVVVRLFDENMEEIVFQGSNDPHTPIALGWLRASHRKLDPDRSTKYRPYHTHDEEQPLTPGEIYEVDIEVWPTCIVAPAGTRIGLSVRGNDYEYPGDPDNDRGYTGVGPFEHDDPRDRPVDVYGGDVTIHSGPEYPSRVLLPIVPDKS